MAYNLRAYLVVEGQVGHKVSTIKARTFGRVISPRIFCIPPELISSSGRTSAAMTG